MADDEKYMGEDQEDDIYSTEITDELIDDDEIKSREQAFMRGYDEDIEKINPRQSGSKVCIYCGYEIDIEDPVCPVCGAVTDETIGET